jgi:hypothetical protein
MRVGFSISCVRHGVPLRIRIFSYAKRPERVSQKIDPLPSFGPPREQRLFPRSNGHSLARVDCRLRHFLPFDGQP